MAIVLACVLGACSTSDENPTLDDDGGAAQVTTPTVPGAALAGSLDEATLEPPHLGDLAFVPPRDCSVPARERSEQDGRSVQVGYQVRFADDGDLIVISYEDLEILEVEGRQPSPMEQASLASVALMPSIVVDPGGAFVEVRGTRDLIEALLGDDPSAGQVLDDPAYEALMSEVTRRQFWDNWIGLWLDWGRFDEAVEEGDWSIEPEVTTPMLMSSLGTTPDGLAALRQEITIEGELLSTAYAAIYAQLLTPGTDPEEAAQRIDGQMRIFVEVVTEPETLRPHSVSSFQDVSLELDGLTQGRTEHRVTELDWDASDC